ncbi:hypothetical protein [Adhaeribacter terreus]|uniref:AI-2E family transporter n=1 Tax=Adhaeribacter terreus TaxID=529703 RepID=A0ABW0EA85_9BACT
MKDIDVSPLISWVIGLVVFTIGALNLLLVHPVPGLVFLLLSLLYFPPADAFFIKSFGKPIPLWAKVLLGFVVVWFTLGVSDLGDMMDDLLMN